MKVLILSATTGGGHMTAANAMKNYILSQNKKDLVIGAAGQRHGHQRQETHRNSMALYICQLIRKVLSTKLLRLLLLF